MKIKEKSAEYIKADGEGRAKLLASTYGLSAHQVWKHKQSGKWIVSHSGVEAIAAQEGLVVLYEVVTISPEFVVLRGSVMSKDGTYVGQQTFGEASPKNTQQSYPVAMAEKRCFDRAILKAVLGWVGGHGGDFYSEEESDDFRADKQDAAPKKGNGKPAPSRPAGWRGALSECKSVEDISRLFKGVSAGMDKESDEYAQLVNDCGERKAELA